MTAVNVDALDAADCPLPRCTPPPGGMCGSCPILHNLLAEVRRGRAQWDIVRELCDSSADGYVPVTWLRDALAAVDAS